MKERLSPAARLLLWAFERGSLPFDILCVLLVAVLLLVPARVWLDPLTDGVAEAPRSLDPKEGR